MDFVELPTIETPIRHALDFQEIYVPEEYGDLTGSYAQCKIGLITTDGSGAKLTLNSNASYTFPTQITWTPATRILVVKISQEDINTIGPGLYRYQFSIINSGQYLWGGTGDIIIRKVV